MRELMNIGLQRRTDLALQALEDLGGGARSGPELAERIGATIAFLPQVMAPLIRGGWVRSHRGPGGGYRLTPAARQVSLLEVIETMEGPGRVGRCVLRDAACPGAETCPVHAAWSEARALLVERLAATPAMSGRGEAS